MAKRKYPSELNTRQVRVNIGDYLLLVELSRKLDITMGDALHLAITDRARQEAVTIVPKTQMPMPIFQVLPQPTIAVNGGKVATLIIKPRGGVIRGQ